MTLVEIFGDDNDVLLKCLFSKIAQLICTSLDNTAVSLTANLKDIEHNEWIHVTISGKSDTSTAYIDVSKNSKSINE
jgi:hypothetical protein